MDEEHTTVVVQRYLDDLAGDTPAECIALAQLVEQRHHTAAAAELARRDREPVA